MSTPRSGQTETIAQVLIVLVIGGMAGAASFTHVHDWTMHNVPAGTGGWFGWANAIISELTPTAAGLEIRRRKRHNRPIAYPTAVLIAAAALSSPPRSPRPHPAPPAGSSPPSRPWPSSPSPNSSYPATPPSGPPRQQAHRMTPHPLPPAHKPLRGHCRRNW